MWHAHTERELAAAKLLDLHILTAAVALGVSPQEGGKFVKSLERDLRAISNGKNPAAANQAAAARDHVRALLRMGATTR